VRQYVCKSEFPYTFSYNFNISCAVVLECTSDSIYEVHWILLFFDMSENPNFLLTFHTVFLFRISTSSVLYFFWLQGKSTYDNIYTGVCCFLVCVKIRISS
jgi:hypothetical protein